METINNFYPEYKLHKCADIKSDTLNNIKFENGYAYATNARVAVRAKIEQISNLTSQEIGMLEGKSIDARSFKDLLKFPKVKVKENGFYVEDERSPVFFGFNTQKELVFPSVDNVIEQAIKNSKYSEKISRIGINVDYLKKLSEAMNCERILMKLNDKGAILCLSALESDDPIEIQGIIMPIVTNED